ncbi:hypothetical protein EKL97_14610 [Flavobacterium sp. LS1P28]|uniref:hypothetical protein n=1 Tax=Flavobacterium sp. LS1P28 TaxID=2497752 RepID=UPI000F82D353|nr:hypothetical protein [Flavobacterium sp. LS1P28]RTY78016.1 hypothetical protein EKL97_14610 [Flavobacterium sp. LS1P28]
MNQKDTNKYFALLEEIETSSKLIILGLGELQNISLNNSFYFLPFQLLSQGLERFMKSYICLAYENTNNEYPTFKYIKSLGHDLESLLEEIIKKYYIDFNRPQYTNDVDFLKKDTDLKELLFIISEFGKKSRYYNFDIITENKDVPLNTKELWDKFENKHLMKDEKLLSKLFSRETEHEVFYKLNSIVIIIFEKFLSALSRQIIFNCIGQKAKQISVTSFYDFGMLYEKDYGNKDYRKNTTRYKETPKKVYKRTIMDDFERKVNPNIKHKKILKSEFDGDWPFYAEEVIIELRYKHWCVITIDGYDYALNGSAKGRYKLENPQDAGMVIMDKNSSAFIKMTLEL